MVKISFDFFFCFLVSSYYLNITIESVRVVLLSRFSDEIRVESDFVWLLLRSVYKLADPQCWWLLHGPVPPPPAPLPPSLPLRLITDDDCEVNLASSCLSHTVSHGLEGFIDNLVFDIDLPIVRSSSWLFFGLTASSGSWLLDDFSTSPWCDGQLPRRLPPFLPPLL